MRKILIALFVIIPFFCFGQIQNVKMSDDMKMVKADPLVKMKVDNPKSQLSDPPAVEFWINCKCNKNVRKTLIVVDGEIVDKDFNMNNISPDDILTFTILKDSAATEKYGQQAKNGVLEIETKTHGAKHAKAEYEITVLSPGYEAFLTTQQSKDFYTESALKTKNSLMVTEWNIRYASPRNYDSNIYEVSVDYDQRISYGLEFEYRLFMFFKFMEKEHNISLLNTPLLSGI